MHALLTLFLLALTAAVDVRVTTVDENTLSGNATALGERGLEITNAEGKLQQLPLDRILRLETGIAPSTAAPPTGEVLLVDGGRLSMDRFTSEASRALVGGTPLHAADGDTFSIKLESIRAVRLMPLVAEIPALETEWRDLVAGDAAGDLIVIRKPAAENLNFVEGTLGNVRPEAVSFGLDGENIDVNRNKVFGVIYFRQAAADASASKAMVTGPGLRLPATKVSIDGDDLLVESPTLGPVKLPLTSVDAVDFSLDRLQYLSDLEPVRDDWTPPPGVAAAKALLGHIARDRGFYSHKLSIEYPIQSLSAEEASSAGLSEIRVFKKGLAIRSRSEVVYRVPRQFTAFRATAGIDPLTRETGNVRLTILGDGKILQEQDIRGGQTPVELECNVQNVRQLTIVVDFGSRAAWSRGIGDNLHLGGARFIK